MSRIAIIGAGLSGLACARALRDEGREVTLFDKGRAAGGRLATRRAEAGRRRLQWDHGAQYLTARGADFAALLAECGAAPWGEPGRFVGVPGMSSLPRTLATGLDLRAGRHVVALEGGPGAWMLRHLDAALVRPGQPLPAAEPHSDGPFDSVAITLPPAQAASLIARPAPGLRQRLESVAIAPCWAVLAAFAERPDWPETLRPEAGPIGWLARDSSKPGRDTAAECWVIQAGPDWSLAHLEDPAETIAPRLLAALPPAPPPLLLKAHRWRYSLVRAPLGEPCLWLPAARIGLAGDWCLAGRAEAAFDSGRALAAALLA
ncbi:NAD(P)-binding protein [Belnapia sp. T6]|uniref:NAD(P)-binding protein n=1 Tax=Belnapia mucosa TaxID=2804532 RepID=A0ABS1V0B1_9PROT|nr:FAD-dependent oxidoreductase [Belnapia mucosa]MBL6455105.1 NAD(P)-binding protein [Belnapia mucosa]